MSKRTRKPLNLNQPVRVQPEKFEDEPWFLDQQGTSNHDRDPAQSFQQQSEELSLGSFLEKQGNGDLQCSKLAEEEDEADRRSLKDLISDDGGSGDQQNPKAASRSSLGHHFIEEKQQLQLVKKPQHQDGLKLKGMVSRYVKVLSHMVRLKHAPGARFGSRKKHLLHLTT